MSDTKITRNTKKISKKKKILFIALGVVFVSLCAIAAFGIYGIRQIKPLEAMANELKNDVSNVMSGVASGDFDAATTMAVKTKEDNAALRDTLTTPYWKAVARLPVVGKQLKSGIRLTEILDIADDEIIFPMIGLLKEHPSDTILADGELNGEAISAYVEFVDAVVPVISNIAEMMKDVDISLIDREGRIHGLVEQITVLADVMNVASGRVVKPLARQLEEYPTNSIKTETGYNNEALRSYLIFIDNILPEVKYVASYIEQKDLNNIDSQGKIREYVSDISQLVDLLSHASEKVIRPLINQLEACPVDNIKADGGFNVVVVNEYLTFIEEVMPGFREVSTEMDELDFVHLDAKGKVTEYKEKLDHIIDTYDEAERYLPVFHTILGDGSDKFYVVAAQNSAEIRASGGFPGSVGSLEIKDGIMKIGDFEPVYKKFLYGVPNGANVTSEESRLFYRINSLSWDAGFCPDFERVGEIWALSYEARCHKHVDGVISLTPSIIQELLRFLGVIELSDGTVLTGENATQFIQNRIYVLYENTLSEENEGDSFVNALFAETAKMTMGLLVSEFKLSYMPDFINVFNNGIRERTIMFWFADEEEQDTTVKAGCSGGLNHDEENPQAGVYFNLLNASKLGWYVDMDYECVGSSMNEDGSITYDIQVNVANIITSKEAASVSGYITYSGDMQYAVYLFAPAGGTVEYVTADANVNHRNEVYNGQELIFLTGSLWTERNITISYKLTTAPGVDTPIVFSATPTLTRYRE